MAAEHFSADEPLAINAWTGAVSPAAVPDAAGMATWALLRQGSGPGPESTLMAPQEVAPWDWRHPRVGWGLVLPDELTLPAEARSRADDAPEPIRQLLAARPGSPVLRWSAAHGNEVLLRYDTKGGYKPLALVSDDGIAPDALPLYLLIAASPQQVPWSFQYAANLRRYVGRLDLAGDALSNYVDALLGGWTGSPRDPRAPLVWSVDHGPRDITWLMDQAISRKLIDAFDADQDGDFARRVGLFGANATGAQLIEALREHHPALVITTSHGMTGPLHDAALTAGQLGVPVDCAHRVLDVEALCQAWSPDGAIWYSHACCAAGSDTRSQYAGLFDSTSEVMRVLDGVAAVCGARVAPLPQRLLGVRRPLAAFVGHVEPTFNWTLRDPRTGQPLTHSVRQTLYDNLFASGGGRPLGWALSQVFKDAAISLALWAQAVRGFNKGLPGALDSALINQLTALDRQHTVILGDPTVALPALKANG
ncbi:hypothetical protein M3A49_22050 [Paraburkholderia sp. CNPSo 3076]|uniref:hypothetical protein n=1 Tax=Paraburkholderia sp. CNPSo 3076 TaxID=2940936 RepID=UPI0022581504|nr:hypothetical protein [Paraburkholderia sp. CNPSo 3076]MCX5542150.1 hypothetical protein [Paraburkholderia sp. CNPSo 3076]